MPCVALIEGETSISPNIIIAQPDTKKADSHYLYAFSASYYGIMQLQRQLKEVAQPTTSTDAVRGLKIVKPEMNAQKYIGDKVRQAERLRAWAKNLAKTLDDEIRSFQVQAKPEYPLYSHTRYSITYRYADWLQPIKQNMSKTRNTFLSVLVQQSDLPAFSKA